MYNYAKINLDVDNYTIFGINF